jgi:hypothetical protein
VTLDRLKPEVEKTIQLLSRKKFTQTQIAGEAIPESGGEFLNHY